MIRQQQRGLTLPEVLVVVTIIVILVGITMPIINVVKRRAKISVSISNLRQLSVAHNLYLGDHENREPASLREVSAYVKNREIWASPLDESSGLNSVGTQTLGHKVSYDWSNHYSQLFEDYEGVAAFVDISAGEQMEKFSSRTPFTFKGEVLRAMRDTSVKSVRIPYTCLDGSTGSIMGRPFWTLFTDNDCPPNICPTGSYDCEP